MIHLEEISMIESLYVLTGKCIKRMKQDEVNLEM